MDEKLVPEKHEKKAALISFDKEALKKIDAAAKRAGVSRTRFVEFACIFYLLREERKQK